MKTKVLFTVICTTLFVSCGLEKKSSETNSANTEKETLLAPSTEGIVKIQPNKKIMAQVGTNSWRGIAYGYGQYVACGLESSVACSSNGGTSWTSIGGVGTSQRVEEWNNVACGNERWVIVGERGYIAQAKADGTTPMFDVERVATGNLLDIVFVNGKFVAVGNFGAVYSTNGIDWEKSDVKGMQCITYGNGKFLGIDSGGYNISQSSDGINWETRNDDLYPTMGVTILGVAYGNGKYVTVGIGGSVYSADGISWTKGSLTNINWNDITFSKGYFVAVGDKGTVAYSTDGVNWEYKTVGSVDYEGVHIME